MPVKMKPFFALPMILAVTACGSIMSTDKQTVTIQTPGSVASMCVLDNGNRYRAEDGKPIEIMRSSRDLNVECFGTNNRKGNVIVKSSFNPWSAANVANGVVPGMAYDYASKGLYAYPEIITVNLDGAVGGGGFGLPQYHDKDMPNPYDAPMESYSASTAKLPKDSGYLKRGIKKRNEEASMNPFDGFYGAKQNLSGVSQMPPVMTPTKESSSMIKPSAVDAPIVPKGTTAEELNKSMNPTVFGQ